jgi:hypothetical protein
MTSILSQPVTSMGGYNLVLIHGFDHTKRKVFHYLAIKKTKLELLKKKISQGEITLSDCGTVLMSEYGYDPSEMIKEEAMKRFMASVAQSGADS